MAPEDAAMNAHETDKISVLIIDDDSQVCRFLSKIFTGMGYSVSHELTLTRGLAHIFQTFPGDLFIDL